MPPHSDKIQARAYTDRHGKTRWRVRLGKLQRDVPPPSHPDHKMRVAKAIVDMEVPKSPHARFTLAWLISDYQLMNDEWAALGDKTRKDKSALMNRMIRAWGKYDIRTLKPSDLIKKMDEVKAAATHNRMKTIWSQILSHAKKRGYVKEDISEHLERRKRATKHTHIWTFEEQQKYCAYWASGTRQRLVYDLMVETCQSCADVASMGLRIDDDGFLGGSRSKTHEAFSVTVSPELTAQLQGKQNQKAYVINSYGDPYTQRGLHNALSKWINQAGLPDRCTPHGLRGLGLTIYAENNATEKELMTIGGFKNSSEVKIYIRAANNRKLAKSAYRKKVAGNLANNYGEPS